MVTSIVKRDGREVPYDEQKIFDAIDKAVAATKSEPRKGRKARVENAKALVTEKISAIASDNKVGVEDIQDIVEQSLMEAGLNHVAKAYILYRSERTNKREMDFSLMKTLHDLTFIDSEDFNLKRENGNIDGDTPMGTMLRYGSEASKTFVDRFVLEPDMAEAHKSGDIHIHDKDFYMLTETCLSADDEVVFRYEFDGRIRKLKLKELDEMFNEYPNGTVLDSKDVSILSGNKFVNIKNCVRHDFGDKTMIRITTECGTLDVTSEHRVVVWCDNEQLDMHVYDLKEGDIMLYNEHDLAFDNCDDLKEELKQAKVLKIEEIDYDGYVYDFETEDNHFNANGFKVHNCCQIDLEKLLDGGFSTGHGVLREPNGIGAYAALTAIAIQANQNDQHGGQSVPNFDYALGKGVAKTFVKEFIKYARIRIELLEEQGFELGEEVEDLLYKLKSVLMSYVDKTGRIMHSNGMDIVRVNLWDAFGKHVGSNIFEFAVGHATDETDKATYQAMEGLIHNLNTMNSRAGRSTAMVEVPVTWETLCPAV